MHCHIVRLVLAMSALMLLIFQRLMLSNSSAIVSSWTVAPAKAIHLKDVWVLLWPSKPDHFFHPSSLANPHATSDYLHGSSWEVWYIPMSPLHNCHRARLASLSRGTVIQKPHSALCDHVITICIANVYTPGANSDARSQPHSTPCQHLGLSACQLITQVVLDHKFIISGQIPGHTKNQTS
jgi:hypothetical protein